MTVLSNSPRLLHRNVFLILRLMIRTNLSFGQVQDKLRLIDHAMEAQNA